MTLDLVKFGHTIFLLKLCSSLTRYLALKHSNSEHIGFPFIAFMCDMDNFVAQVVRKLLSLFSDENYSQLMEWIYKFSRNTKISYRVFALDLLSELLTVPKRTPTEGIICTGGY